MSLTLEFVNSHISKHKLNAPENSVITIIKESGNEILLSINGKPVWTEKRKVQEKYVPKCKRTDQPISGIPDLELSGNAYKMLQWIKSLEVKKFNRERASMELHISIKTVTACLDELVKRGKIRLERFNGVGFKVIVVDNFCELH